MERIKQAIEKARQQAMLQGTLVPDDSPRHAGRDWSDDLASVRRVELDPAHLEAHRVVSLDGSNPYRREFDLLRTQVLQKLDEHGWRTLAVTSPTLESGKTVVAINLAMSIAHYQDRPVLLVDFDLRRPKIASYLGIDSGRSLNDAISGTAGLLECMVSAGLPRFYVLPTLQSVAGAAEVLSAERVASIIHELRTRYPGLVIIFDLPPVNAVDDAIAVMPRMDCALLVVGSGVSTRRELEESQRHLARTHVVGMVVNKAAGQRRPAAYY